MNRLVILLSGIIACSGPKQESVVEEVSLGVEVASEYPKNLTEWPLFEGKLADLRPAKGVEPYSLNAALFSDYAHKARFISLPEDGQMNYHSSEAFGFPVGTVLVKNFYYPVDFRKTEAEHRILETRLLVREAEEWKALVYQWNEAQNEATLLLTGAEVPVEWTDNRGQLQRISYAIPSQPQCKSCHDLNGKLTPIGPTARQLNKQGQLQAWKQKGLLSDLPDGPLPKLVDYADASARVSDRARAWLEINCAHCHRREGPAKNTGLYLMANETDAYRLGVNKPPIAAGKGSGGMKYSIVPGKPEASILVHRIRSLEPGEMMPELGRKLRHEEGIDLIERWITEMDPVKK